jgi:hypothetical protein
LYTRNIALDLQGTIWYTLEGPGWENGGLLNSDQSPKPAYIAYRFMTHKLRDATYVGKAPGAPTWRGYTFSKNQSLIQVIWSADGTSHTISVPASQLIGAWDKLGNPIATSGDPVSLDVSSPIYLEITP